MKLVCITLLSIISLSFAVPYKSHAVSRNQAFEKKFRLQKNLRKEEEAKGCNINVCFAIDGSLAISNKEYESQLHFSFDVTSILIDFPVSYGAVVYDRGTEEVSSLTNDVSNLIVTLLNTTQSRRQRTSIGQGIEYCSTQTNRHTEDLNSVFLFTDGRANGDKGPVEKANQFRLRGGTLFVVGVGSRDEKSLLDIAGGDPSKVLDVDSFLDTLSATNYLEDSFNDTCGSTAETTSPSPTPPNDPL